ncbi:methyltransferase, TIGR04325 family [Roseofilum capinflatum]|uniref:Methyltransferase, TIGR04325 family n=1 Tax=Roseofilum capinflatum BLCC-M114 TaxID=3022440 RepID=A0ABT7B0G6_9CYAN|nr:methyltransferase, TIGR04325 family [Roseofilum capinflatum]MDJ1172664.1 methyltransferase, TIGR04325 family [Roseofilum capinflatum BLCC-M114]
MFWDDIKLVTEQVQKYGLRKPFVDLGGLEKPTIADYNITIQTQDQYSRYIHLNQRPFDHIDPEYLVLNPENDSPEIEALPSLYSNFFGTAVCLNVIEHVENPFEVFDAFYKIMKPEGLLIIETVFSFPYHPSPRDYWRYSAECLKNLSQQAGFKVLECDWRLLIRADEGIEVIQEIPGLYKKHHPQEIMTVYATLTKSEKPIQHNLVNYQLPQRLSSDARARLTIKIEDLQTQLKQNRYGCQESPENLDCIHSCKQVRQQLCETLLTTPLEQLPVTQKLHQQVLDSLIKDCPRTEKENELLNFALKYLDSTSYQPQWEYVPEGWLRRNEKIKGWNIQDILDVRIDQWKGLVEQLKKNALLSHDYSQQNNYILWSYVLSLTAQKKEEISILDWGGGLGEYYLIAKALLPNVKINYSCAEVPVLCEAGRSLHTDVTFYEEDRDCFAHEYDLVFCSSALQYAQDWQTLIENMVKSTRLYLYITRLPIVQNHSSFVVLQRAYSYGYNTEYLSWFLNLHELVNYVENLNMKKVRDFLIAERFPVPGAPEVGEGRGLLFARNSE